MAAKPVTDPKDLDPRGYYTIWEKPPGKTTIWVIDRSYSGIFFRDNWDDLQRAWKRSRNDTILVPKGIDPNKLKLGYGFPEDLLVYEDALEKMLRFYPNWVAETVVKFAKQPEILWLSQDLNKAVDGLYKGVEHVEALMKRDKNGRLEQKVPGAHRALAQAKKAAWAVDDLAATLQDDPDRTARNIKKMIGVYVKALKPFYDVIGFLPTKVAAKWEGPLPKGWTDESRKKFWDDLTAKAPKHKVTECMKRMKGKISDPGAFCASLADREIPGWRQEVAKERAKKAAWMTPGKVYEIKGSSQDRAWWFVAQQEQKNGGMKGLFVSWSLDRRVPEKAINKSVDSVWSRQWKEIKPSDVPKEVLARFSAKGVRLASRGIPMTDPLLIKVARLAKDHPELRPKLMPIIREARAKTARPIELRNADVMLYMVDPSINASKFYEMNVVPAGDETRAKAQKDFSRGRPAFVLQKRWGRLKDNGQPGRVDSENDFFDNERDAIAAMRAHAASKTRKGYQDVTRKGEYPLGLGAAGFGWGGQAACRVIPELNFLEGAVTEALGALRYTDKKIAPIAQIDSSMAKKLAAMLKTAITDLTKIDQYLDDQISACR